MTNLEEGPAAPTTTPSAPAASGEAPPVRLEDTTPVDYAHWGYDPAPGARLELKEIRAKDRQRPHAAHLSSTEFRLSGGRGLRALAHAVGRSRRPLLCQSNRLYDRRRWKARMSGPSPAGAPPAAGAHCISLEKLLIQIDGYHKGEPMDYAIVSTDGAVRAYARGYPFPIEAQDGECSLTVEMENSNFTAFVIRGAGFGASENVATSSSFGGEAAGGTQQASSQGEFAVALRAELPGKNSGSATFTATGNPATPASPTNGEKRQKGAVIDWRIDNKSDSNTAAKAVAKETFPRLHTQLLVLRLQLQLMIAVRFRVIGRAVRQLVLQSQVLRDLLKDLPKTHCPRDRKHSAAGTLRKLLQRFEPRIGACSPPTAAPSNPAHAL